MNPIVIGIDGGGTHTRAVAASLAGQVLAAVRAGAASPNKTTDAEANVRGAIRDVVAQAGRALADVVCIAAGIAGLDADTDLEWANRFVAVPGVNCPRLLVNDAVVAHAGALLGKPGIIAIAGTGCIVFGVTETGQSVRNYDFFHYAPCAARLLSYDLVYRILAGEASPDDDSLVADVLRFWKVADVAELQKCGRAGFVADTFERNRVFGEMAPWITAAALAGVPLACDVCDTAVKALALGIRLVGNCFAERTVSVAFIGSVANSEYVRRRVAQSLGQTKGKEYRTVDNVLASEIGAVIMGLTHLGVSPGDTIIAALREYSAP